MMAFLRLSRGSAFLCAMSGRSPEAVEVLESVVDFVSQESCFLRFKSESWESGDVCRPGVWLLALVWVMVFMILSFLFSDYIAYGIF